MHRYFHAFIAVLWFYSGITCGYALPPRFFFGGAPATSAPPEPSGPTYALVERFEASPGYDNTGWVESGSATFNADYTASLAGSQSLLVSAVAQTTSLTSKTLTLGSTTYVHLLIRPISYSSSSQFFRLRSSSTTVATVSWTSSGTVRVVATGGSIGVTTSAMALNTTYHLYFVYTVGGGTNSTGYIGFSTDGSFPMSGNNFAQCINGTSTLIPDNVSFGYANPNTFSFVADDLSVSTTDFATFPPVLP